MEASVKKDAILMRKKGPISEIDGSVYSDRLGGAPWMPVSATWPTWQYRHGALSHPLHFIAQIDCSGLPPIPDRNLLPKSGLLTFFSLANSVDDDWHQDSPGPGVATYYPGGPAQAKLRMPPAELADIQVYSDIIERKPSNTFPQMDVELVPVTTFDSDADYFAKAEDGHERHTQLSDDALRAALGSTELPEADTPKHRSHMYNGNWLLGFAEFHQPNAVETAFDKFVSLGLTDPGRNKPSDLILLAQLDTCYSGTGMIFGDCGKIHFWILEGDLKQHQFNRAVGTVDAT